MNPGKWFKDSFIFGTVSGIISLTIFYLILSWFRSLVIDFYGNPFMLRPPTVQLVAMLLNVILFRVLIINFDKEKTGKGLLFITVIGTLIYFFILFKFKK